MIVDVLVPLEDRVVIQPITETEDKIGSLFVPESAKEKPMTGHVTAAGPGRITEQGIAVPLSVKVGDKVLYGKYSGTEITIAQIEYLVLREADILAIIGSKEVADPPLLLEAQS